MPAGSLCFPRKAEFGREEGDEASYQGSQGSWLLGLSLKMCMMVEILQKSSKGMICPYKLGRKLLDWL